MAKRLVLILVVGAMVAVAWLHFYKPYPSRAEIAQFALAARKDDVAQVRWLLDHRAECHLVKSQDNRRATALHWLALHGNLELVQRLVRRGASVARGDRDGRTPLHYAAGGHSLEVVKFLIASGASVNAKSTVGETPLFDACRAGYAPTVSFLISKGAIADASDGYGIRPLDIASGLRSADVFKLLASRSAKLSQRALNQYVFSAANSGSADLAAFVVGHGAHVNARRWDGATPLFVAAVGGNLEVARFLVAQGAGVNTKTWNAVDERTEKGSSRDLYLPPHTTPLRAATECGHNDVAEFLRKHGGTE